MGDRVKSKSKPRFPRKIPYDRQAQRLGQVFVQAQRNLISYAEGVDVASDPRAVIPERCLVFELLGDVAQFNLAAQALGLEWLATQVASDDADATEEAEEVEGGADPAAQPAQRLYLTMPTEHALKGLLRQWERYESGKDPRPEHKPLWKLFDYLHALRVWSVEDRLDPSLASYVSNALADRSNRGVILEIDLWYRTEAERRDQSLDTLTALLQEVGGELLDEVDIQEIQYQGALVRLPREAARTLIEGHGRIAQFNDAMTIRPQSAYESKIEAEDGEAKEALAEPDLQRDGIAALLDGYPIGEHDALAGRLNVIEVDIAGKDAPVATRNHGTAMASLIVHGDLQSPFTEPLNRPLAVVPVLLAPAAHRRETTPAGKLPIGVIYRALNAIITSNDGESPELDKIVVINHSICDDFAPFVRRPSPWATLLDYFGHRHRLLFVVSAGNIWSAFPISAYADLASFSADTATNREAAILAAIEMAKGNRGLLSPAESINSLTVGASHQDEAQPSAHAPPDPYPSYAMSNLASALGLGVNKCVKPDLLAEGGRFAAGVSNMRTGGIEVHARASAHFGQEVAAPSSTGALDRRIRTSGTSNAAALTTRAAHEIADAIEDLYAEEDIDWTTLDTRAVILKTLLAHGAGWGEIGSVLDEVYPPRDRNLWAARRSTITKFLGYGQIDTSRVVSGRKHRITLLADGMIRGGERHEYEIPVPPSMVGNRDIRTCTVTLSWTCPVTHTTADQRGVVLQLRGTDNDTSFWSGVKRKGRFQPNIATANRGTLIHVIQDGTSKIKTDDGRLVIAVQATCKEGFERSEAPYALAITLELAQQQNSRLYEEVRESVRVRPRVRLRSRS